jgi:hypothetical protein
MKSAVMRRRLLKGSLAAPVLLTVSSASAHARSSFGRCLRNADKQQPAEFFTTDADRWLRKQVTVARLWAKGRDQGYFYLDPVKNVYVSVNPPYQALPFGALLDHGWKVSGQSTRWALVWFDKATATEYSRITLQKPSGSAAATVSCYGSFRRVV